MYTSRTHSTFSWKVLQEEPLSVHLSPRIFMPHTTHVLHASGLYIFSQSAKSVSFCICYPLRVSLDEMEMIGPLSGLESNLQIRNNRCGYQSVTQQYLKRCLIKVEINYMFRPNVAIIRFTSESMVVLLYRIGMDMSRWWDLSICFTSVTYPYQSCKAIPPYFRMQTWWWSH